MSDILQVPENEWVTFPGGELEGKRPRRLCPACRDQLQRTVAGGRSSVRPLAARGESLAAFDGRCIPADCVAPRSNTRGILGRRALPAGRLARLGATPDSHHGPQGTAPVTPPRRPLCFQCYLVELDREKALRAAGELDTASDARFQVTLPFEPVDQPRLAALKAARVAERAVATAGASAGVGPVAGGFVGGFSDRRRHAQIAARHALQTIAAGLKHHQIAAPAGERVFSAAVHAAELQLPESWLPFVVAR